MICENRILNPYTYEQKSVEFVGQILCRCGEDKAAILYLHQLIQSCTGDRHVITWQLSLAKCLMRLKRHSECEVLLREKIEPTLRAECDIPLSQSLSDFAVQCVTSAQYHHDTARIEALVQYIAVFYLSRGEMQLSLYMLKESLDDLEKQQHIEKALQENRGLLLPDIKMLYNSFYRMGHVRSFMGLFESAESFFLKAIEMLQKVHRESFWGEVTLLNDLIGCYLDLGLYHSAFTYFVHHRNTLRQQMQVGDERLIHEYFGQLLWQMSSVMGLFCKALQFCALTEYDQTPLWLYSDHNHTRGTAFLNIGDYSRAFEIYNNVLSRISHDNTTHPLVKEFQIAQTMFYYGCVHTKAENHKEAMECFNMAVRQVKAA